MVRLSWLLSIGLLLVVVASPARADERAYAIARSVDARYRKTRTFRAPFSQVFYDRVHKHSRSSAGTVTVARGGKFSFRYSTPRGNVIVSDGKIVKIYERKNRRMYRTKFKRSRYPGVLSFLMGKGSLARDFKLRVLKPSKLRLRRGVVLEAIARDHTPAYRKLLLYLDGSDYRVERVAVIDGRGNVNRFTFGAAKENMRVSGRTFRFTPPPGTRVIRP